MDTTKIKKGLGRGLSSLIGETKTEININKALISDCRVISFNQENYLIKKVYKI